MNITGTTNEKVSYDTLDDWHLLPDGSIHVPVVDTGNPDSNLLIFIHAFVEAYLCQRQGVSEELVTGFDMEFKGRGEPGNDPRAPYYNQHQCAMIVERAAARALDVNWMYHQLTCREAYRKLVKEQKSGKD